MSRPFEWRTSRVLLPYMLRWLSLAAVLAFRLHRGLVELIAVMSALGIAVTLLK